MPTLLVAALTVVYLTSFTAGSLNPTEDWLTDTGLLQNKDNQCPPWTYFDDLIEQCECYSDVQFYSSSRLIVRCTQDKTSLLYDHCMTYDEESGTTLLSYCLYFKLQGHNTSEPGMILLPDNISELSDYMCGPMNRKGVLCSQCIDGYGPSVTSRKFQCSPCSGVWYGVPLYLILELVPVTVFYIFILLLQFNLTTAPMIGFVFYSNYNSIWAIINIFISNGNQAYVTVIDFLHGIWTLDFFRYSIPPFCVSPNLETIHIFYLQSVSAIFPYLLIIITWILINLHSRDCKVVVWMWKKLNRVILKHFNVKMNSSRTVIDAFATFFLLTFVKLLSMLLIPIAPMTTTQVNNFNHSISHTT